MSFDVQQQMLHNFTQFCLALKDQQVTIKDNTGCAYQGKVQSVSPLEKTILIRNCNEVFFNQQYPYKLWKLTDLTFIRLKAPSQQVFKTDPETSKNRCSREPKRLIKWNEGEDNELQLEQGQTQAHFDQFEANLERFGVTATFDEESYTTSLKLQQVDDSLKEYATQQMNALVRNSNQEKNNHILEERNLKMPDEDIEEDEEARFSAVIGAGSYKNPRLPKAREEEFTNQPPGLAFQPTKFFNSKIQDPIITTQPRVPLTLKCVEGSERFKIRKVDNPSRLTMQFKQSSAVGFTKALEIFNWQKLVPEWNKNKLTHRSQILPEAKKFSVTPTSGPTQHPQDFPKPKKSLRDIKLRTNPQLQEFNLDQLAPQNIGKDIQDKNPQRKSDNFASLNQGFYQTVPNLQLNQQPYYNYQQFYYNQQFYPFQQHQFQNLPEYNQSQQQQ